MGTQKEIAKQIINRKADYILALKGNQSKLQIRVAERIVRIGSGTKKTPYVTLRLIYVVADLYRRRWRIEDAFNSLYARLNVIRTDYVFSQWGDRECSNFRARLIPL